ncbi:tRNA dimethylallyltransferase [Synergistales bacterium]|nr:tRNA dimethylallyltransferase [Synergistales bacterium]
MDSLNENPNERNIRELTAENIVPAVIGPTAAGKTRAAFELARALGGEIISVDSRQVYRYLDIGTDKISAADRKIVPHHLIDIADPDEVFTAADFVRLTEGAVKRIRARGKIPILAGGTPMYYKALSGCVLSDGIPSDEETRKKLYAEDIANLRRKLREADAASAERIHPNDKLRISRALEIYILTGRPASEIYARNDKIGASLKVFYFGFTSPRERLYEKISARAAGQFAAGYADEVKWLLDNGYGPELPALQGFGYRELTEYIHGKITLDEALLGDIRATKAFSKRQMTWFKHFSPAIWYDMSVISLEDAVNGMIGIITGGANSV